MSDFKSTTSLFHTADAGTRKYKMRLPPAQNAAACERRMIERRHGGARLASPISKLQRGSAQLRLIQHFGMRYARVLE